MSEIKHTPGPWKRDHLTIVDERGMKIAQVEAPHRMLKGAERNEDLEWCKGNARAVSAIPELVKAAVAAQAWLTASNSPAHLRELIDAAISKVKGSKS